MTPITPTITKVESDNFEKFKEHVNHMAGPRGPISSWLSHRLCSTINITPTFSTKAAIDCSHRELHGDIHIKIIIMVTQLVIFRGIMLIF